MVSCRVAVAGSMLGFAVAACGFATPLPDDHVESAAALLGMEQMRIGSVEDPELGFSRISHVDVAADGRLFVGEAQDVQIRVYSPDGRLVHRVGRRGGGPGEFQAMPTFGLRGDTLWTYDQAAGRITLFTTAGDVISTGPTHGVPIPLRQGRGWVMPLAMLPGGRFSSDLRRVSFSPDDPPSGIGPSDAIPVPRLVFDATGAVVDTAGWEPMPPPRMVPPPGHESEFRSIEVGGRPFQVPSHGSTLPIWIALDDGRVILDQPIAGSADATFHLTRLGLNWDTAWHRSFQYRAQPFDPAELDSAAARSARGASIISGGRPPPPDEEIGPIARQIRAAMDWPDFKLPFFYAFAGQDGSIWLARSTAPGDDASWFVVNADGTPRGNVSMPTRSRVLHVNGEQVWAAVPDEFDVPWLVSFRLRDN